MTGGPGNKTGTAETRVGPAVKRAIRDVFTPDAAGDERLDGLIEQLRSLDWPTMNGRARPDADAQGNGG